MKQILDAGLMMSDKGYEETTTETQQFAMTKARHDVLMTDKKELRVIIAGGRDIYDYQLVLDAIQECQFPIDTVVSGGAPGVDALGEKYAVEMNKKLQIFMANWKENGRAAGPMRNRRMAENADALIAIWDGKSRGTKNMIETAEKKGLLVYVKRTDWIKK